MDRQECDIDLLHNISAYIIMIIKILEDKL